MTATQIRIGQILVVDGQLGRVMKVEHLTPGNYNPSVQVKLRNLKTGNSIEKRFRPTETVERAEMEQVKVEYLYNDSEGFHFMNHETYETITLGEDIVGDNKLLLTEHLEINIEYYEEQALSIQLPKAVTLKVTETAPNVRNATITDARKPATLETGLVVNVPSFITTGELIKVSTETREYLERAK